MDKIIKLKLVAKDRKEVSKRNNQGKIDLTNLSPTALLPHFSEINNLMIGVLELTLEGLIQSAMSLMAKRFPEVIEEAALIMKRGETEYGRDNWKIGMAHKSILQSLYRHVYKFCNDEEFDADSGYKHIGHIYCNLMFLDYHMQKGFLSESEPN